MAISRAGGILDTEVRIGSKRVFTLEQARGLLGLVFKITKEASLVAEPLIAELERLSQSGDTDAVQKVEADLNVIIVRWHEKIRRLGALPQGLWLVDFDCGQGFLCWKYPEPDIMYWHGYSEGFSNRKPVSELFPLVSVPSSKEEPVFHNPDGHKGL